MAAKSTENITLLSELHLRQHTISQAYAYVGMNENRLNNLIYTTLSKTQRKTYSLKNVPDYMKTVVSDSNILKERKFSSVQGYSVKLDGCSDVDNYMGKYLSKSHRKTINRTLKRLETCFDIRYRIFLGNITEGEYLFLMERLKSMIIERFEQRGHKSHSLLVWDKVLHTSLELIRQKKASIFVIYDKDIPINISFQYNYNTLLFSYIACYDIHYAKFGLGQLAIYKQLEWCINNSYSRFDLGWGDLDYKKWWSNNIYRYYHNILYPKYSISGLIYALVQGNKSRILAFLISRGVNTKFHSIKKKLKGEKTSPKTEQIYTFETLTETSKDSWEVIDLNRNDIPIDKKIINDFLYLTQEHSDNITLYYSMTDKSYAIKGKKSSKKVLLNNKNR